MPHMTAKLSRASSAAEHLTENQGCAQFDSGARHQIMFQNIDLKKFLKISYIFEKTPPANSTVLYLAIIFGFFIILGLFFWIWHSRQLLSFWKKYRAKIANLFFYNGVIGLFLTFGRWQQIPYLGSRFFLLVEICLFIIWGSLIFYYRLIILPKEIKQFEQKKQFEKYLPSRQAGLPRRR